MNTMLFLIEYNRKRGEIVSMTSFEDADKEAAEETRLKLELCLNLIGVKNEIVLLDATTESALRRTHRRYFESLEELATVSDL